MTHSEIHRRLRAVDLAAGIFGGVLGGMSWREAYRQDVAELLDDIAVLQTDLVRADAACLLARLEALVAMGLWGPFVTQNRALVDDLIAKLDGGPKP